MGKKLYVGNLSYDVSSSDLEAMLTPHGTVHSAEVIMDRNTGQSKGLGFVEMDSDSWSGVVQSLVSWPSMSGAALVVDGPLCG